MTSEQIAILTLVGYLLIAVTWFLYYARKAPSGWQLWTLSVVNRFYMNIAFHWRSNRYYPYPGSGPALVVANHRSPVDPLFLWMNAHQHPDWNNVRPIEFLTAREFCGFKGFLGFVTRTTRSIPVDRDGKDMGPVREALRRLEEGRIVGVFPEGRINKVSPDVLLPGNTGVAWLALKANVPVYPAFIHNAPQGETMIGSFYMFRRISVSYGEPLDLSKYQGKKVSREVLAEVTDLMMNRIAELGGVTLLEEDPTDQLASETSTVPMNDQVKATG